MTKLELISSTSYLPFPFGFTLTTTGLSFVSNSDVTTTKNIVNTPKPKNNDYTITDKNYGADGGAKTRFANNVAAIKLLKTIEKENIECGINGVYNCWACVMGVHCGGSRGSVFLVRFQRTLAQDNVLYLNKNKSQEMFERWGEQYSELTNNLSSDIIIHQSK